MACQVRDQEEKAIAHIVFCLKVFRLQIALAAYFLMEHPAYADRWKLPEIIEFKELPGVTSTVAESVCMG